jgi:hypothetical protein
MLHAGPEVLTEPPTIHELHANLYFEWHQFSQLPEVMRAGLDKAAAAGVQVLMVLDREEGFFGMMLPRNGPIGSTFLRPQGRLLHSRSPEVFGTV